MFQIGEIWNFLDSGLSVFEFANYRTLKVWDSLKLWIFKICMF